MRKTRSTLTHMTSFLASAFVLMLLSAPAQAQDSQDTFAATNGNSITIDRWGVCKDVTGAENNPVMIPTRNQGEWLPGQNSSFLESGARGTTVRACMVKHPVVTLDSNGTIVPNYCSAHPNSEIKTVSGVSAHSPDGRFWLLNANTGATGAYPGKFSVDGRTYTADGIQKNSLTRGDYDRYRSKIFYSGNFKVALFATGFGSDRPIRQIDISNVGGFINPIRTVFSPEGSKFISISNGGSGGYALSRTDRIAFTYINSNIYAINQDASNGAFSASRITSLNLPSASGTTYDFVKFTFGDKLYFHKIVTNVSNSLLEYAVDDSGYSFVKEIPLPQGVNLVSMSDDGSEILAYDNSGRSYTLVKDDSTGNYNTVQTMVGDLVPKILAPGGTVAVNYTNYTPGPCTQRRLSRDEWRTVCAPPTYGRIATYKKDNPDSPTWIKVFQNNNLSDVFDNEGSQAKYGPMIATDGTKMSMNGGTLNTYNALKESESLINGFPAETDLLGGVYQQGGNGRDGGGGYDPVYYSVTRYKCQ